MAKWQKKHIFLTKTYITLWGFLLLMTPKLYRLSALDPLGDQSQGSSGVLWGHQVQESPYRYICFFLTHFKIIFSDKGNNGPKWLPTWVSHHSKNFPACNIFELPHYFWNDPNTLKILWWSQRQRGSTDYTMIPYDCWAWQQLKYTHQLWDELLWI